MTEGLTDQAGKQRDLERFASELEACWAREFQGCTSYFISLSNTARKEIYWLFLSAAATLFLLIAFSYSLELHWGANPDASNDVAMGGTALVAAVFVLALGTFLMMLTGRLVRLKEIVAIPSQEVKNSIFGYPESRVAETKHIGKILRILFTYLQL